MKPIQQFAEYNKDNVLGNFLQAEMHLKNLESYDNPDFAACVNKHLLEAQMELNELVAHEPENAEYYRNVMLETRRLRRDNIDRQIHPEEAIDRLRSIRGGFEKHVAGHDVEKCKGCLDIEETVEKIRGEAKGLNRGEDKISNNSIQNKEINMNVLKPLAGAFIGKGISEGTKRVIPGTTFGIQNKTIVNLVAGIGIVGLYALKKKKLPKTLEKMEVPLLTAAGFLIANELVDMGLAYLPAGAAPSAPSTYAGNSVMKISASNSYAGVPQFANQKHIFVD